MLTFPQCIIDMNKPAILIAFTLAVFLAGNSYAQKDKKESYKKFKSRSSFQSSAPALLKEANELKNNNPQECLNKVEEALGITLAEGDEFNEGKSYELLGEINESIQEWTLALENYNKAYDKLANDFASSVEFQSTLQGLGNTHLKLGHFDESLRYFQEALSLRLSQPERYERWLDVAEVYYQMGNYDESLKALDNIPIPGRISLPSFDNRLQNLKAKISARKNEPGKTQDLYQNPINSLRGNKAVAPKEKESLQNAKEEISEVFREQKRYDDEIQLRNQSIEYNLESNNLAEVTKDKVEIGKTLVAKGANKAALKELEEAAKIADTLDNPKEQANAFLALADLYEKNGRKDQALMTYKKYSLAVSKKDKVDENRLAVKSNLINKQNDIEELSKNVSLGQREETIEKATVFRQQLIIYGLLLIILIIAVTSYFIYKNAQASKMANQLLALKSLRGQMNPHFIFNALNSVNHFIAQQDERTANKFLSEFSQLMRLVLETSQEDFIPLEREQEILSLYLKLEHYRFRDKFNYEIKMEDHLFSEAIEVPPMLIQPYIENAVWHGLRYKEEKGNLLLRFRKEAENLVVEITDDGIGRAKSSELKTENQKKHNSTGLKNIQERLTIINKVYKASYRVTIEDLENTSGTRVRIYLPVNHRTQRER